MKQTCTVQVLFFGVLEELAGHSKMEMTLDSPLSLNELLLDLKHRIPQLLTMDPMIAHNQEVREDFSFLLADGDEIALMPPFTGG